MSIMVKGARGAEEKNGDAVVVSLSPQDAFFVTQCVRLIEVLDDYLEIVRLNNAEHVLCEDPFFLHSLSAYDVASNRVQEPTAKAALKKKYEVFNTRCSNDEIMWA